MRYKISLAILIVIFLIGCTTNACNPPYIRFGDSCCLDKNENNICDSDEEDTVSVEEIDEEDTVSVEEIDEENTILSASEIYKNSKESLFFIETICVYEVKYPNFKVTFDYDADYDFLEIFVKPTTGEFTMEDEEEQMGSGFLLENQLYSNLHVINCEQDLFQEEVRLSYKDYANLDYEGYIINQSILDWNYITGDKIIEDLDPTINKIYDEILELDEGYSGKTGFTKEIVESYLVAQIAIHLSENLIIKPIGTEISAFNEDDFDKPWKLKISQRGSVFPDKDFVIFDIYEPNTENHPYQSSLLSASNLDLNIGEEIYVIGFPGITLEYDVEKLFKKEPPVITKGIISSIKKSDSDIKYYVIDAASYFGSSGGPVLNNYGEVIGILTAGVDVVNLNFMLPLSEIK